MLVSYLMSVTSGTIKIAIRVEKSLNRLRRLVPLIREKIGLCFIKRSREGWSTTDAVVVVTYITRQIFNCIFSIVKERQGVPYGLYQSHTQPLSSCSFAFDQRACRRMATLQTMQPVTNHSCGTIKRNFGKKISWEVSRFICV